MGPGDPTIGHLLALGGEAPVGPGARRTASRGPLRPRLASAKRGVHLAFMARGIGENPALSPAEHLRQIEYPATRDEIVETAGDNDAPIEVINFLKCLPKESYDSYEAALRDFAEAERRFGMSNRADGPKRENINRVDPTQHP
ncbi:MAG: DUF2795 domain-containing protein [Deltaproteobacteria bacterium]|nr:MAG: DUF2795 domain-containing protein [Deltaproteobacteria bacterium]TMB29557.1 MAG: DUF2795 domain-containing protein [Deltaproteobacteria bacterium]